MTGEPTKILLVEDDPAHAGAIGRAFRSLGESVRLTTASSLREAFDCLEASQPDLVIADWLLPDGKGLELLAGDKEALPYPIVVMTSHGNEETAVQAMRAGALDYIVKSDTTFADMPHITERTLREWGHIVDRKKAEDHIKASLAEKEVMLREIHHRVKNNLAVIDGLLTLQFERSSGKSTEEIFEEIQARIRSMAVAHEMIYQSENLAYLDISDYMGNLVDHLRQSHERMDTVISLEKEIEHVSFGLDTAIPLGFLITELVSNCLKHAWLEQGEGEVRITLKPTSDSEFELVVRDNGVGMSEAPDLEDPKSMGFALIAAYVEQLHGEVEFTGSKGTEVRIKFREVDHGTGSRRWRR